MASIQDARDELNRILKELELVIEKMHMNTLNLYAEYQ